MLEISLYVIREPARASETFSIAQNTTLHCVNIWDYEFSRMWARRIRNDESYTVFRYGEIPDDVHLYEEVYGYGPMWSEEWGMIEDEEYLLLKRKPLKRVTLNHFQSLPLNVLENVFQFACHPTGKLWSDIMLGVRYLRVGAYLEARRMNGWAKPYHRRDYISEMKSEEWSVLQADGSYKTLWICFNHRNYGWCNPLSNEWALLRAEAQLMGITDVFNQT